jgi:hypothetical protein
VLLLELRRRGTVEPPGQVPSTTRLVREPTRVVIWSPILDRQRGLAGVTVVGPLDGRDGLR